MNKSYLEENLFSQIQEANLPLPERQYKFHPHRKWPLDFAWPQRKIGVEVEGGVWSRGKHGRGSGIVKDIEKINAALLMDWKIYRVYVNMIEDGSALELIREALQL